MSFTTKYNSDYFNEIDRNRIDTLTALQKSDNYYFYDEVELEVGDWFIEYVKWQHPSHNKWQSSNIFTSYEFQDIEENIPEDSISLHIGADTGYYSVAYNFYSNKVIAFEPNPVSYELLRQNAKLNPNIIPYNVGCSTEDKKETWWYRDETLYKNGNSDSCDVYLVNLNNFLNELHSDDIDKIKFIHIGFEDKDNIVLSTLSDIIKKNNPKIITKGNESNYETI